MSNSLFSFIKSFKKENIFNETLTVTYVFNKKLFDYSSFFILPYETKRNVKIFLCLEKIDFFYKLKEVDIIKYDKNFFSKKFFRKKYNYYFFDSFSYNKLKSDNIISIFLRKKIKIGYSFNNILNNFKILKKLIKKKNLITYSISSKKNFISFPFSTFSCGSKKSVKNFNFVNKNFYFLLKINGYDYKSIKKIIVSSTNKKKIFLKDEKYFYKFKK
ncbi:hypothetical protein ACWNYI_00020 [Candidatus Vidania fulgoroideorum]